MNPLNFIFNDVGMSDHIRNQLEWNEMFRNFGLSNNFDHMLQ